MREAAVKYDMTTIGLDKFVLSTDALNTSMSIVKPLIKSEIEKPLGKIVIGMVQDDVYDIGKKLVNTMLEVAKNLMG